MRTLAYYEELLIEAPELETYVNVTHVTIEDDEYLDYEEDAQELDFN